MGTAAVLIQLVKDMSVPADAAEKEAEDKKKNKKELDPNYTNISEDYTKEWDRVAEGPRAAVYEPAPNSFVADSLMTPALWKLQNMEQQRAYLAGLNDAVAAVTKSKVRVFDSLEHLDSVLKGRPGGLALDHLALGLLLLQKQYVAGKAEAGEEEFSMQVERGKIVGKIVLSGEIGGEFSVEVGIKAGFSIAEVGGSGGVLDRGGRRKWGSSPCRSESRISGVLGRTTRSASRVTRCEGPTTTCGGFLKSVP